MYVLAWLQGCVRCPQWIYHLSSLRQPGTTSTPKLAHAPNHEPFNNQYSREMSVIMWYGIVAPPTQPKCFVTPPTVCVSCALGMHVVVKSNLV